MRYWPLYVMLLPCIVYYALICYVPMAGSVLAFKDYSFKKGIWGSPWVGFDYFKTFFKSYDAGRLIRNTLAIGIIKCILEFPFAIILALLLNELRNMKFKKISQTITYLPHFLSSVIIVTMLQKILAPNTGILNQAIAALGGDGSTFFLMDAKYFYRILFSMDLWKNIGWDSIMYLAAISSVDPTLYEAAEMDGCGKLKKMWHITLPGIRGTIGILFITGNRRTAFLRCRSGMAAAYTRQHVDCRYIGYLRSACRLAGRTVRLCDGNWSDTGAGWTGTGCSVQQDL